MTEEKERVLVVDDEESVRNLLQRVLKEAGYDVEAAANGQEALDLAAESNLALVLLDIRMPGKSGLEVLRELRANHPDTAVIMATAINDVNVAVDTMREGAFDYLTKPFNLNELVISVARVMERRRLILENRDYQLALQKQLTALNNLFQSHLNLRQETEGLYARLCNGISQMAAEIQALAREAEAGRALLETPPVDRSREQREKPEENLEK